MTPAASRLNIVRNRNEGQITFSNTPTYILRGNIMLLKTIYTTKPDLATFDPSSPYTNNASIIGIYEREVIQTLPVPYEVNYVDLKHLGHFAGDPKIPSNIAIIIAMLSEGKEHKYTGEYIYIEKDVEAYILSDDGKTVTTLQRCWKAATNQE